MNFFSRDWKKALTTFQSSDQLERRFISFHTLLLLVTVLKNIALDSWSAISRGAVRKGFNVSVEDEIVVNAISKYSYGTPYTTPWDPARHFEEDKYYCDFELRHRATNQLQWYLKRVSLYDSCFLQNF